MRLIAGGLASGNLRFTDDFRDAMDSSDVVFVCVGTPPGPDGEADTTAIRGVTVAIAQNLRHYHVIVTKSTVPIGTGFWLGSLIEDILGAAGRDRFGVVSNPEFLREGSAVQDFLHPDRVVLGSDDPKARRSRPVSTAPSSSSDPGRRGEAGRRAAAADQADHGGDGQVRLQRLPGHQDQLRQRDRPALRLRGCRYHRGHRGHGTRHPHRRPVPRRRPRLGRIVFREGPLRSHHHRQRIRVPAENSRGRRLGQRVATQVRGRPAARPPQDAPGSQDLHSGAAFKPHTDDLRDSPALDVATRLIGKGAFVAAYDPMVTAVPDVPDIRLMPDAIRAAANADAIVLATDWPQFLSVRLTELRRSMRGDLFFDSRNNFDPFLVEQAGFRYVGIGRGGATTPPRVIAHRSHRALRPKKSVCDDDSDPP